MTLTPSSSGIQRSRSFKDKITDYHGTIKGQIEKTKSLFMDTRQEELARKANLTATQKVYDFRQRLRDYRLATDHLATEYANSKELSFLRRYSKMKIIIKRILIQASQLATPVPVCDEGYSQNNKDVVAKIPKLEGMSRQEVIDDSKRMEEQATDIAARLEVVKAAFQQLDKDYKESKRYPPWNRYLILKSMIKNALQCKSTLSSA